MSRIVSPARPGKATLKPSRRLTALSLATLTASGALTAAFSAPAQAATTPRPLFKAPFSCNETWVGTNGRHHSDPDSIDFNWGTGSQDKGKAVRASAAGTVIRSGLYSDGVSAVEIDHGGGWKTRYLHMQTNTLIRKGTKVTAGTIVGKVGDVGSPGAHHLHYDQYDGTRIVQAYFDGAPWRHTTGRAPIKSTNCGQPTPNPAVSGHDFSGDGKADVLARTSTGELYLYKGSGTGGFQSGRTKIGNGWNAFNTLLTPGDFSGDRKADLLARNAAGALYLYRGNGAGGFQAGVKIGTGWGGFTAVVTPGDFTGDGKPDVLARTSAGELYLYKGSGTGGFQSGRTKVGTGWNGFTAVVGAGDLSGDGKPDLLARTTTGELYLYKGSGTGGFQSGRTKVGTGWNGFTTLLAPGDYNGDRKADLLARNAAGDLYLYKGTGTGGFQAGVKIGSGWKAFTAIA
ncbi:FG-GAP-like repeat-containing protein [Streptomyces sp. NPDC058486]|uniref:FG-GAP-like repeat-containing protein n=1 Tax=unclassified Streptomyces TaxID=2593676 RepID=UPI00366937A8